MAIVGDILWPSDNEFGIPLLDADLQVEALILPLFKWGATPRCALVRGTYHFYTDDYKFNALWANPWTVVQSGIGQVIEINASINGQMPRAVALWRIYQKRWVARWWQSQGVRILVDLNVAPCHAQDNLLGVPSGWRAYATRALAADPEALLHDYDLACARAGNSKLLFVVYGGGQPARELCQQRGWVWLEDERTVARRKVRGGQE